MERRGSSDHIFIVIRVNGAYRVDTNIADGANGPAHFIGNTVFTVHNHGPDRLSQYQSNSIVHKCQNSPICTYSGVFTKARAMWVPTRSRSAHVRLGRRSKTAPPSQSSYTRQGCWQNTTPNRRQSRHVVKKSFWFMVATTVWLTNTSSADRVRWQKSSA